ncbi:MAG: GNAT family N-acetyltransferase [Candidatus Marinimicrobia bacterium]|jgi:ribosomal protein S18 acetylase RimI-like enzyme|nr:GNAT family N-acetyltransferase [Candidatus Neomarinimicrobiota bacterium]
MVNEITIEQVSYKDAEQARILKACLETWFQNPKDLNLTAPQMTYPFNFNRWIADSYSRDNTLTFVLKKDKWIIGYMSLQLQPKNDFIHLFHVFIDRSFRGKGFGKLLAQKAISYTEEENIPAITLFVNPNNQLAIKLYESFGFTEVGYSKTGSLKMLLNINKSKNQ